MAVKGPPQGRQSRSEVTRTLLLDAAQEIIADRGYHGAAMDDIVEAADRSKGAAYFHFPSKSDIFEAVLVRLADRLENKVQQAISPKRTALERLDAALTTVLSTFAKHRRMARIALVELPAGNSPLQDTILVMRGRFARLIETQLDAAIAEGAIDPLNCRLVSRAWFGAIAEVVTEWLRTGNKKTLEAEMPELCVTLLRSVGAEIEPGGAAGNNGVSQDA
ncbi:MAG: TetR/AcrR family transcriptional regulator [Chloroflexi bacterium]|nr:TetR/AcrR family transcriptional regulator [Chloroflexota bacterium]